MRYAYLIVAALILGLVPGSLIEWERRSGVGYLRQDLAMNRAQLALIADCLRRDAREHGHYPSNDSGLLASETLTWDVFAARDDPRLKWGLHETRQAPSGLLSIWGEPFIYENRRGVEDARFEFSGATDDRDRAYSVRVADGVYVWSLAAQQANADYVRRRYVPYVACALTWLAVAVLMALYLGAVRTVGRNRRGVSRVGRVALSLFGGTALLVLISGFLFPMTNRSCYARSWGRRRTPELTREYIALIHKYRDRGIISDKAYAKILDGLRTDGAEER